MARPDSPFPDLSFRRVLFDPTAISRAAWQVDKRGALPYIGLELGIAVISIIVGVETQPLAGVEIYAIGRLLMAASTLPSFTESA